MYNNKRCRPLVHPKVASSRTRYTMLSQTYRGLCLLVPGTSSCRTAEKWTVALMLNFTERRPVYLCGEVVSQYCVKLFRSSCSLPLLPFVWGWGDEKGAGCCQGGLLWDIPIRLLITSKLPSQPCASKPFESLCTFMIGIWRHLRASVLFSQSLL